MTEPKDFRMSEDWLKIIYSEAWNQYTHEDNLGQSRTNFFLGIQAALIAILTAVSGPIVQIGSIQVGIYEIKFGLLLLGVLALIIGFFSLVIVKNWRAVTKAGQQYLNLRWISIAAIENLAKIERFGLAVLENEWRTFSRQNPGEDYQPFKDIPELEYLRLTSLQKTRSWASMLNVILLLEVIHYFIIVCGVTIIIIAIL
ncbi:MAG: hypothetical protein HS126_27835 [Anaerolineales bacterium]|nr:hypothetical protein [Anaerolineales bacterium]